MKPLIRYPEETVEDFLFHIYNNLGCADVAISCNQNIDGNLVWSRRIKYSELMPLSHKRWVKGTFNPEKGRAFSKHELLNIAAHRTILDIEVMIDIDDEKHKFINFKTIKDKAKYVMFALRAEGKHPVAYFTGSKSYHISFLEPSLRDKPYWWRKQYRERLLSKYGGDIGLAAETHTVALEGAVHYVSGKRKERVEL